MTAVMVEVPAATGGGTGAAVPAWNQRGRALIMPGTTASVVVPFVSGLHKIRGFRVEGDGDAFVWIKVDDVSYSGPLYGLAARKSIVKDAYLILPNPEAYPSSSSIVSLLVTNLSAVSVDFEGVVFGE